MIELKYKLTTNCWDHAVLRKSLRMVSILSNIFLKAWRSPEFFRKSSVWKKLSSFTLLRNASITTLNAWNNSNTKLHQWVISKQRMSASNGGTHPMVMHKTILWGSVFKLQHSVNCHNHRLWMVVAIYWMLQFKKNWLV